ncbi:MAG: LacI family transcriptional regulator [Limisphaerales bacterium]|nr:MAG: LacI family transcriptional regulator [Limisphaerales bacterium]KAG0507482.1 MAG: LacI family transcriptional regulator [Limisphaerales bacterium]TXT50719.1 MAG: LacI family transcriptional regulator [Limisphaerales bacterium]
MKQVALLIETSNAYARGLLRGVVAYLREHEPWSLHLAEHGRGDRPPSWLASWCGDGILARIETPAMARALRRIKAPIVDVSAARLIPALPWFETDDAAIAQMAFEHLRDRGYRHFAYCGDTRFNWSNWRGEHFQRAVAAEGGECHFYQPARHFRPDDAAQGDDLVRWLRKLPKPVGVMACYDLHGRQLLDACRRAGIAVPDEVAVISVDNDEVLCELSHPPLTSVIPNTHRTGYEAAALLDELMAGRKLRAETRLVPPVGVAARQSTSSLAIEDRQTALAVRFIREKACSGINVSDVLQAVPQSRRLLESRFRRLLGRTPHEEILRVQLDRVKQLLVETDLPLSEVAERAGFAHVEYLSVVFKRETGIPPSAFRRANR